MINALKSNNNSYISQAFSWFGFALLLSAGGIGIGIKFANLFFSSPVIFYMAIAAELIMAFTAQMWVKKEWAIHAFAGFALLSGLTAVPILLAAGAMGGFGIILKALVSAGAAFGAAALYGYTTKSDLNGLRSFLLPMLFGLILAGIINIFLKSTLIEFVGAGIGVVVFTIWAAVDIQRIRSSNYGASPILAGMSLYLDFFNLFISILRLFMFFGNRY